MFKILYPENKGPLEDLNSEKDILDAFFCNVHMLFMYLSIGLAPNLSSVT